jgi:hypothetical protein
VKPLPPYRIDLFNIADQTSFGTYWSNQVPQRGDLVTYFGSYSPSNPERQGDAYHSWCAWKVDQIMWHVASPGSRTAFDLAQHAGSSFDGNGYCNWVELHVMPAQGLHYDDTPPWAKMSAPIYHAPDEEDADA